MTPETLTQILAAEPGTKATGTKAATVFGMESRMSEPRRKTHAKVELVRRAGDERAPYHASVQPGGPDHVVLYLDVNPEDAMSDFIRIEMHYSEARWLAAELALAEIHRPSVLDPAEVADDFGATRTKPENLSELVGGNRVAVAHVV